MKTFLLQFFTWWHGQTLGTRFFTWRKGEKVGEDAFGNTYYRAPDVPPLGERRWVIYNGIAEPSRIPPGWYGWMHHRTDAVPVDDKVYEWEKPWVPNMTGTAAAYRPAGSTLTPARRPPATGDYEAWNPGD